MGMDKIMSKLALLLTAFLWGAVAQAIPALQIGQGTGDGWDYTSETWIYTSGSAPDTFNILTTANATDGNGKYAWDALGGADGYQYAYLIVAAVPQVTKDPFDISVADDNGALTMVSSGYGTPPLEDTNSISPHGIFDTYFEVYEFQFDDAATTISDTQPGGTGTGSGFEESLDITINSLDAALAGIHFDLFTTTGSRWTPSLTLTPGIRMLRGRGAQGTGDKWLVNSVAPYSHDAQMKLSEPGTLGMMLIGMMGVGASRIRRRRSGK